MSLARTLSNAIEGFTNGALGGLQLGTNIRQSQFQQARMARQESRQVQQLKSEEQRRRKDAIRRQYEAGDRVGAIEAAKELGDESFVAELTNLEQTALKAGATELAATTAGVSGQVMNAPISTPEQRAGVATDAAKGAAVVEAGAAKLAGEVGLAGPQPTQMPTPATLSTQGALVPGTVETAPGFGGQPAVSQPVGEALRRARMAADQMKARGSAVQSLSVALAGLDPMASSETNAKIFDKAAQLDQQAGGNPEDFRRMQLQMQRDMRQVRNTFYSSPQYLKSATIEELRNPSDNVDVDQYVLSIMGGIADSREKEELKDAAEDERKLYSDASQALMLARTFSGVNQIEAKAFVNQAADIYDALGKQERATILRANADKIAKFSATQDFNQWKQKQLEQYTNYTPQFSPIFQSMGIETDGQYHLEKFAEYVNKVKPILFPEAAKADSTSSVDLPDLVASKAAEALRRSNMAEVDKAKVRVAYDIYKQKGGSAANDFLAALEKLGFVFEPATGNIHAVNALNAPFLPASPSDIIPMREASPSDVIPLGEAIRGAAQGTSQAIRNVVPRTRQAIDTAAQDALRVAKTGVKAAKALPRAGQILTERRKASGVSF